ncbi:zinc finger protein [Colletotrichum truncatum]|uniref:Zinc finger protein n=1 Tax=Colletotrichum truncatum TaxID=5467 RepID=A0ACC3YHT6_COLTU|nr:zinc finger protein [Colletotrichum truncatum]KAF6786003.1 zinc finger protein [Colletotrichum truncatum]
MPEFTDGTRPPGLHFGPEAGALIDAADKFKAILNTNDAKDFAASREELVLSDLKLMQQKQQQTRTLVNLNRLHMFLNGMRSLQTVLTELGFEHVKSVMACIWGPMRYLFQTTNTNEKAFDHILDVYQRLGLQIPPLADYIQLFQSQSSRETRLCLVHIYRDVLEFHTIAYKLFSRDPSLWPKLHRATWRDLDSTFDHLSKTLKLHCTIIQELGYPFRDVYASRTDSGFGAEPTSMSDGDMRKFHQYRYDYDDAWRKFRRSEATRKAEQKDKIIKWIAAPNKTEMLHLQFEEIRKPCPENGTWLWKQHDAVSNWMKEDIPEWSAIWLHGARGMGKTILSSLVVDHLRKLAEKGREVPKTAQVCYFYCQEGDQDLDTYLGILRGILHQLVDAAVIPNPDEEPPDEDASRMNGNLAILPLCEDKMTTSGGSILSNSDVAQALMDVFFESNSRQYVIIDGLDECKATEIQQAVKWFTEEVSARDGTSQGQLRVLFMTQTAKDVTKFMTKYGIEAESGEVKLDPKDNKEDIRRYVNRMLNPKEGERRGFNLSEWEKQDIEDKISARSDGKSFIIPKEYDVQTNEQLGLFLYAHLAMEYLLEQDTKSDLLDNVKPGMLPRELKDMYGKLLGTLKDRLLKKGPAHWAKAKLLLGWLICAHRPLKWHEIQAILSFDPEAEVIDFDLKMIRADITDILGSLVQILPGDNIRLIHSTAKEYLVQTKDIDAKAVQCDLAILCLRYLSLRCFVADDYSEAERRKDILEGYFSFQDYAMSQWYKHIITLIQGCRDVFPDANNTAAAASAHFHAPYHHTTTTTDHTAALTLALAKFISAHDADIKPLPEATAAAAAADVPRADIDKFQTLPFYPLLLRLWGHICQHQDASSEERNKVGIPRLDAALKAHRALIERDYHKPSRRTTNEDTMQDYYGPNMFKCSRTLCKFFHHGFDNKKDRDGHQNRHDRPYPCPLEERCGFAPVGFSSNKDRQRHVRNYHPEHSDAPSAFLQMSRRVESAKFQCNICQKSFTRNINLKGHERSHFGERPYACSHCGKAFARLNDCRRHERIHTRNRA